MNNRNTNRTPNIFKETRELSVDEISVALLSYYRGIEIILLFLLHETFTCFLMMSPVLILTFLGAILGNVAIGA